MWVRACVGACARACVICPDEGARSGVHQTKKFSSYQTLSLKPGVGQVIALHASPTARNYAFKISAVLVHLAPRAPVPP